MCRQNQLWGCMIIAFGIGLLIGLSLKGGFLCVCLGFGLLLVGACVAGKK